MNDNIKHFPITVLPQHPKKSFFSGLFASLKKKNEPTTSFEQARERKEDLITEQERTLLANTLKLRDLKVIDVMIPRADIFAVDASLTQVELFELLAEQQFSRVPVYKSSLDDVLGTIHIKDVLACVARGEEVEIEKLVNEVPIVSPAMTTLDLLLEMRQSRRHMAFVVDEYGGIDGLVTINDIVESILGEIYDEHDAVETSKIIMREDGTALADARMPIYEFEERFGAMLNEEERSNSDTLGGLVSTMSGRIPARGDVLTHQTGMIFEVLDADPRRVNLLRIRNIPVQKNAEQA